MEEGKEEMEEQQGVRQQQHIKKRALKNKALSISFNEKELRDYVTGFHKRKKKRRKEAQKIQQEKLRKHRNEERKQRKHEREVALFGRTSHPIVERSKSLTDQEESKSVELIHGETIYDQGDMKVTVTTIEMTKKSEEDWSCEMIAKARPKEMVEKRSLSQSQAKFTPRRIVKMKRK